LDPRLLQAVADVGFEDPTPIQDQAIPILLKGKDLIASAATGSGKTAAFVLPILHRLLPKPRGKTRVLILTPTRELAVQISDHLAGLAIHTPIAGAAVFGGMPMNPQARAFEQGADVIVATPGRLLDHLRYPYANLSNVEVLVLDEADRMLDMGFLPDVRRIMDAVPRTRQTLMFSATLPPPIVKLSKDILRDPVTVRLQEKTRPADGIEQSVYPVRQEEKPALLAELLRREAPKSVIAFCRTKSRAEKVSRFLEREGVLCARIHGDRSQSQRLEALDGLKSGRYQVLVATDVAARGIDVEGLSAVINVDVPRQAEDYVHRIGRTARAHLTGDAFTLVAPEEERELAKIEKVLGRKLPRRKLEGFVPHSFLETAGKRRGRYPASLGPSRAGSSAPRGDAGAAAQSPAAPARRTLRDRELWEAMQAAQGGPFVPPRGVSLPSRRRR
jgi:ATP-dependent RNA helicase RhlE